MKLLLDTRVVIWALAEPTKIPRGTLATIRDPGNAVLFSAASIWEIAIKLQGRRLRSSLSPNDVAQAALASGFEELPIRSDAAARVRDLPMHHPDPFDRILVAQALCEAATLLTADRALLPYSDLVRLI